MTDPVPFLDLRRQTRLLRSEIDAALGRVLERADFVKGAAVGDFEEAFADYQQSRECVAVANGTDALEIALAALGLPPNSEVIVPANSFIATSEAVSRSGLTVVFADVDETYTLDPHDVVGRITDKTSAIIAVHLYGQPADMESLSRLARDHGLRLVEDAAQAHGADIEGRRVGAIGDVGTFSFYPGKNLGALGDAGAITTNDAALATACRRLADHGRIGKYDHDREGRNSRMDTIQAAVLSAKLRHLDEWIALRRSAASTYMDLLASLDPTATNGGGPARSVWESPVAPGELRLPVVRPGVRHSYHLFVVRVDQRDVVRQRLSSAGVQTGIHYPTLIPRLAAYEAHPQHRAPYACGSWTSELLSLPMGEHMDETAVDRVATTLRSVLA